MIDEQLEFRIAQYADGTLPAEEIAALEALLASDAGARATLESYRKLDAAMKREMALPAVNWDRLARHLSDAVGEKERGNYTIPLFTWGRAAVAMAAMVLIAIGTVAWLSHRPNRSNIAIQIGPPNATGTNLVQVAEVSGPRVESAAQPAVEEVAIGPSAAASHASYAAAEDIIDRTPRVVIASVQARRQDMGALPF